VARSSDVSGPGVRWSRAEPAAQSRLIAIVWLGAAGLLTAACDRGPAPTPALPAAASGPAALVAPAPLAPVASAGAATSTGGVAFTRQPPKVGDRFVEQMTIETQLQLSTRKGDGPPQKSDLATREAETREEQILALSGDAVTKVQVTYTERTEVMKEGGRESKTPSPLAGRTYVLQARDGKTSVLTPAGRPAPTAQARQVESSCPHLGRPEPILAGMPGRPLVPGEKVPELEGALRAELAGRAKDMPVSAAAVTFAGVEGDDGLFDVTLELSKEERPMKYTIALRGRLRVSRTASQLRGFALEGPMTIGTAAGEQRTKVEGQGTLKLASRRQPR